MSAKRPRAPKTGGQRAEQALPATPSIEDRIRLRAYELFEARNGGPGDADGDWYQAEAELTGKIAETE